MACAGSRIACVFCSLFGVCSFLWAWDCVGQEGTVGGKALRGKEIFERICSVCHGLDGGGQGELGFKLTSGQVVLWSDEALIEKIAYGNLTLGMPRFGEEFLDEGRMTDFGSFDEPPDIEAVVAYIRVMQRSAGEALLEGASAGAPAIPASADASLGPSLMLFIRSATVGAGQAVAVNTFTHSTRTFNLLYNWPLTPTGTIVYEVFSIARMPAHVVAASANSLDIAVFLRIFGADYESKTFEKMIEIIAAMVGGVTTGAGTTSEVFKSFTNATTAATITNDGTNRTAVTIP